MRFRTSSDARCERARECASQRVDGELSELERLLLRRHLGRCGACRAFLENISVVSTVLRETEELVPARRILVAAPRRPETRRPRLRVALAVGLIALAAGLGAFAGLIVSGGGGDEAPGRPDVVRLPQPPAPQEPTPTTPDTEDRPVAPV